MNNRIEIQSNYLWLMTLTFSMVIVLANWFDPRLIQLFGITTDAGTLVFPVTFLLSDLITEVYGYKYARRAIWCGFIFNAIFILYGQLVIHMPNPDYPTNNALFDTLFAINIRIIFASAISYMCSEPLSAYLIAKTKIKWQGRFIGARFVFSTVIASFADSVIFTLFAFYGTMSDGHLLSLALSMWLIKVVIEVIGLPVSVYLAKKLKQIDKVDMYDNQTQFTLFSLETSYAEKNNEYH